MSAQITSRKKEDEQYGERLGLMYKRWTLDCIVTSGFAVSEDFINRPELYQQVDDEIAESLTNLQSKYGFDPKFPNNEMRLTLMKPIFGISDGEAKKDGDSAFHTTRMNLISAATDFSENAQPTGFPMLRERIRSAVVPFKTHLVDLKGTSLYQSENRIKAIFDTAQKILKDHNVFVVFGINGEIDPNWPLQSDDPQGAKLIEKITNQLPNLPSGSISRDKFVRMQRMAEKGYQSIFKILETDIEKDDAKLDELIAQLYAWGSDLGLISSITS